MDVQRADPGSDRGGGSGILGDLRRFCGRALPGGYICRMSPISRNLTATGPVAEAVAWMSSALGPVQNSSGLAPAEQIWEIKEFATLVAMLACFASLFPLVLLLLRLPFFADLRQPMGEGYVSSKQDFRRGAVINGIFMLLYLGLIMVIFGFHVYLVQIDKVFPMMIVNGIAFWFLVSNLLGFWAFKRWFRRKHTADGLTMIDLGISSAPEKLRFNGLRIGKTALLALIAVWVRLPVRACAGSLVDRGLPLHLPVCQ